MPNILEVMEVLRIAVIKAMRIEIWKEYGLIKFNVLPSIPNPITIWKKYNIASEIQTPISWWSTISAAIAKQFNFLQGN